MISGGTRDIVLFTVGNFTCGIDICSVHEIKRSSGITIVYGIADDISGVINLRGQIVTVLDMRKRFSVVAEEITGEERIIIVPFGKEAVGLLVDSVEDAITIENDTLLPVPPNVNSKIGHFFTSVYQWEMRIISLVNLAELVRVEES